MLANSDRNPPDEPNKGMNRWMSRGHDHLSPALREKIDRWRNSEKHAHRVRGTQDRDRTVRRMRCVRAAAAPRMTAGAESRLVDGVLTDSKYVQTDLIARLDLFDQVGADGRRLMARLCRS